MCWVLTNLRIIQSALMEITYFVLNALVRSIASAPNTPIPKESGIFDGKFHSKPPPLGIALVQT